MGYSPWGRKESDTTERLHLHFHNIQLSRLLQNLRLLLIPSPLPSSGKSILVTTILAQAGVVPSLLTTILSICPMSDPVAKSI